MIKMPTQIQKYKFVSPSIQTREVDNTKRPRRTEEIGPVIIGRAERGPSFVPVQIKDRNEFLQTFGKPIPGGGTSNNDVWRDGNYTSPTYGAYAAYAYLKNRGPVTFIRLAGDQHSEATTAGAAGWPQDGFFTPDPVVSKNAGAYGLFLIDSGNLVSDFGNITGSLAAVFYMNSGSSVRLDGDTNYGMSINGSELSGAGQFVYNVEGDNTFKAIIKEGSGNAITASFNFNPDSEKYIRKVFNTNPILTNSEIIDSTSQNYRRYWLGQTYEDFATRNLVSGSTAKTTFGVIVPLASGSTHGGDFRFAGKRAKTGWVFSQDMTSNNTAYQPQNMTKLFRLKTHTASEWEQKNLKISISNIKSSKNLSNQYGSFDVEIRKIDDNDKSKQVVERFTSCNLNPASEDYIAKKIGNTYRSWDYGKRQWIEYGDYENRSKFVYVEVANEVDNSLTDPRLLPFGFYGTPRFKTATMTRTSILTAEDIKNGTLEQNAAFVRGSGSMPHAPSGSQPNDVLDGVEKITLGESGATQNIYDVDTFSASFAFPTHPLVVSSSDVNTTSPFDAYFGIDPYRNGSKRIVAENHVDIVSALPENFEDDERSVEISYYFSLDDVRQASASVPAATPGAPTSQWYADAFYESGSRVIGLAINVTGAYSPLTTQTTPSYESILTAGFNKFTMPLYGGFEGVDVTEKEPFRNSILKNGTETTNYAFHSIQRAIDSISDVETIEFKEAVIPGVKNTTLTRKLIDVCEERGDALALIDLEGDYTPNTENTSDEATRRGDVDTTISNLRDRGINSSYGACFYPWVKIRDEFSDTTIDVPPSIVALGSLAYAERVSEPWFASAGWNRGGLSNGVSGLSVINVKEKLNQEQRDKLYEANINPIAKFNRNEIVIMGNKTLQVTPSALDRINVRRLMIVLKKIVSNEAKDILFANNVKTTWARFISKVEPKLRSIKARFGLSDYRLVLNEETTTEDLVDRNIMYAQIYLKPARAIEYIAIDFVLEPSGASFED